MRIVGELGALGDERGRSSSRSAVGGRAAAHGAPVSGEAVGGACGASVVMVRLGLVACHTSDRRGLRTCWNPSNDLKNASPGGRRGQDTVAPCVPDPRHRPAGRPQRGHRRPGPARATGRSCQPPSPRCSRPSPSSTGSAPRSGYRGARSSSTWSCTRLTASRPRSGPPSSTSCPPPASRRVPRTVPACSEESDAERRGSDARRHRAAGARTACILKAPDTPRSSRPSDDLADAGIPVVTLVTDVPLSRRVAYVGIDNRAAGATAAYLITQWRTRPRRDLGAGDA